jgi:TRAP transporter TAXI family solute receptor
VQGRPEQTLARALTVAPRAAQNALPAVTPAPTVAPAIQIEEETMLNRIGGAVAFACVVALAAPVHAEQVTFMTGPQGGSWIPLGGALKNLWEKAIPGLSIQETPGAGIANVRGVEENKAQIGFANSATTVDGIEGRAPYPAKTTHVCQVANLYPQYFQVVALKDANVKAFADLKGKALVTQPKGNTAEILTALVLKINGMSYASLSKTNYQAAYTDAVGMMKDGHAQVFTLGTTSPASAVMDLASARDIDLVPVDDKTMSELHKMNPGYVKLAIKAGTYPKQDKDIAAIGYSTHIVARCDLPEKTVYEMTKAMATHVDDMAAVVKPIHGLTAKDMAVDIGVPLHKGALKYYKEVGAL